MSLKNRGKYVRIDVKKSTKNQRGKKASSIAEFKNIFLISVILTSLFAVAPAAEAYTPPYQVMVFTDKQVYLDYGYDLASGVRSSSNDNTKGSFNQRPNVFAVLMDSDGNIVRGLTSANFSGNLSDVERWNHTGVALNNYPFYQVISTGGMYYPSSTNTFPTFTDTDNDGIFNSTRDVTDVNDLTGNKPPTTDQLNISINVTINYLGVNYTKKVYVIFGTAGCYHPGNTFTSAHDKTAHNDVTCTTCHWGYQYALGTHGPDNSIMNSDTARFLGVPAWTTITNWDYRTGLRNGTNYVTTWDNSNSSYCLMCHGSLLNRNILDLGVGGSTSDTDLNDDGINDGGRPSCSWYQGPLGNNSGYPVCHGPQQGVDGSTKIVLSSLNGTDWTGWSQKPGASKSHNHSASPNTNGTACELCHAGGGAPGTGTGGLHMIAGLPNRTSDFTNINDQCQLCHNITDGWLNVTSNGGLAKNHSITQCSNCHIDNNKMDSHKIPTGAYGGKWCLDCHNTTGKAPITMKVDPAIINVSNPEYIHYDLNKNSDTANSSRICWACHTNDSYLENGRVNSTNIPVDTHPGGYDTPRNCTSCHNNANQSQNYGAEQNEKHTWFSSEMNTPAVTYCTDCHDQEEMIISWNPLIYPPKSRNETSAHYGKNRTSFFGPLIGTREYCGYCHQNESTVMGPFANPMNVVRSDHASQSSTPGCGDSQCHEPGRLHETSLVTPNFTEANIDSTCLNCHSSTDYNFHNNSLTCWDCHMGNVSNTNPTWIHPIQFIQYNGNFTGAKLTAATCYDCHKSTRVDGTINSLSGKVSPKILEQSHSNDPMNGTKWGDYWRYNHTTYEFASYEILGNGTVNPDYPFENIKVPSNDYMEVIETSSGSSNKPVMVPYNENEREFALIPVSNWTSSIARGGTTTNGIVNAQQDATIGNPVGSLKAMLRSGGSSGTYRGYVWWNYSFEYSPDTGDFEYTNASADYNITVPSGNTLNQTVYLRLVKPSGSFVTLASASSTTNTGWQELSNNSFASALDESGSYKVQLYTEFQGVRTSKTYTVNYDNIVLKFQEKVWNRYEVVINTTGIPLSGASKLGMSYQVHTENASFMILNKTSGTYELLDTLNSGVFFDYVKNISSTHHIDSSDGVTGNVSVKFIDNDQGDTDAVPDKLHIRYLYIYTDRGLQYPCEQCHSPNKHYVSPTLGSPEKFNAGNSVNQTISSGSTWCQQCHWEGAANYSNMIQEFSVARNPTENIPPEITGNATYAPLGGARDGTAYYDHTGLDMDDAACFSCHGAAGDTTMTQFIHNVQESTNGTDTTPPASVTALGETATGETSITWTWTNPSDPDFDHVEVYLDSVFKTNITSGTYTVTGLNASTTYIIGTKTVDTVGNINTTIVSDSATTASDATPPSSVTGLGETATGETSITWSWTNPSDPDFDHVEVYLDSVFKTNVTSGTYTATGLNASTAYTIGTKTVDTTGNVNGTTITDSAITSADATPPVSVTGLGETATGETSITWTWTNPSDSDFDHVEVYLDSVFKTNVTSGTYTATGLNASTTYTIGTKTVDTVGNVNASMVTDPATTASDATPPASVTALGETATGETSITWSWTNPSDPDFDHVEVYLDSVFKTNVTSGTYTATGLNASTTYTIGTKTVDTTGNINATVVSDSAITSADVTPPASVTVLGETATDETSITWSWTNPSDPDFDHVEVYLDSVFKVNVTSGTYTPTGLNASTTYIIGIKTVDTTGNVNSTTVTDSATTASDATPPSGVTALGETATGETSITWSWTNPSDSDFDHVEVYLDSVFKTNITSGTYTATGLNANTTYIIGTKTVDTVGNINATTITDSATTSADTTPPASVTALGETATGETSITWSWTNPSDSDFDHVEVYLDSVFKTNVTSGTYTAIGLNASTTYTIGTKTVDTTGNMNGTTITDSAITSADVTPPVSVTALGETATGETSITWSWTNPSDSDFDHVEVYLDSVFKTNV
ncbi:MAG: hypothetical protein FIB07_10320, partial [Candidatus Methanoperedens sp.]|nr:hypothetical protein [Candidatus Methanoperedens sp.]